MKRQLPACKKHFSGTSKELDCFSRKWSERCQDCEASGREMIVPSVNFSSGLGLDNSRRPFVFSQENSWKSPKGDNCRIPLLLFGYSRKIPCPTGRTIASAFGLLRSFVVKELADERKREEARKQLLSSS